MIDAMIWFALGVVACAFAGAAFSARVRSAVADVYYKILGWFAKPKPPADPVDPDGRP